MPQPITKVIVVGGGSAGFMSALTLKTMLPELEVAIVHSSALPPIGVGESTTSLLPQFLHGGLGIDQQSFYRSVRPSWKLGIRFEDWGAPDASHFYYPFDEEPGARAGTLGKEKAYYFFADQQVASRNTALMDLGKSPCFPSADGSVAIDRSFGYHIENQAFIHFLESTAANRGVTILDRQVLNIAVDDGGNVESLELDDETNLFGDLFVDCTGFSARLLGETLEEPFVGYDSSLFCDTAVTSNWQRDAGVLPYTNCRTMNHGWCWNIELADQVSCGYVFGSQFCTPDEAATEMRSVYPQIGNDSGDANDIATVSFRSGRHERFWVKNVAAVGNASGFVEPLESTGLHMIAVTARTLGQALVDNDLCITKSMQRGINNYIGQIWDDIRDCLALHFAFNQRRNTPFWQHCRINTDLASAKRVVDFYFENGPSSLGANLIPRNSIFRHDGYLSILIGQRVPSTYTFHPNPSEQHQWQQIRQQVHEKSIPRSIHGRRASPSHTNPITQAYETHLHAKRVVYCFVQPSTWLSNLDTKSN